MRALEIIRLRAPHADPEALASRIRAAIGTRGRVLRRAGLETDLAVHIDGSIPEESALGLQLASELRAFGLVEHAVWEEPERPGRPRDGR